MFLSWSKKGIENRLLGSALAVLALAAATHLACAQNQTPKTSIPEIARIGGVQIGYSTQEDLAGKWGKGKTLVGGHSNSGRLWRIKGTHWRVNTDGFDYSERGLVVDGLSLDTYPDAPDDIPYAKLSKADFSWLGGILPGMSRTKVLQILKRRSLRVTSTKEGCEISERGFSPLTSVITPLRIWQVTLTFAKELLIRIDLSAAPDHSSPSL